EAAVQELFNVNAQLLERENNCRSMDAELMSLRNSSQFSKEEQNKVSVICSTLSMQLLEELKKSLDKQEQSRIVKDSKQKEIEYIIAECDLWQAKQTDFFENLRVGKLL